MTYVPAWCKSCPSHNLTTRHARTDYENPAAPRRPAARDEAESSTIDEEDDDAEAPDEEGEGAEASGTAAGYALPCRCAA